MLVNMKLEANGVYEDFISRLKTLLDKMIFDGRTETKLTILAFLYCGEFVKNSSWYTSWDGSLIE